MKWFTIGPAWGDAFVCYFNMLCNPEYQNNKNAIFYPSDYDIVKLFTQDRILDNYKVVEWPAMMRNISLKNWYFNWHNADAERDTLLRLANTSGEIIGNHGLNWSDSPSRLHPIRSRKTNKELLSSLDIDSGEYILFYPISNNSLSYDTHYRSRDKIFHFLNSLKIKSILSYNKFIDCEFKNIINLTGCTPSMEDVFSLANSAKVVITTSSGLSFYCAANNIPSIILCNDGVAYHNAQKVWRKTLELGQNCLLVDPFDPIQVFQDKFFSLMAKNNYEY